MVIFIILFFSLGNLWALDTAHNSNIFAKGESNHSQKKIGICSANSKRPKSKFFSFSSDEPPNIGKAKKLMQKYCPSLTANDCAITLGVDAGFGIDKKNRSEVKNHVKLLEDTLKISREVGALPHVYLGGPFGRTAGKMELDESIRQQNAAREVMGEKLPKNWKNQWANWGWLQFNRKHIAKLNAQGFASYEIDNLGEIGIKGPQKLVDFYIAQQEWQEKNNINMTLTLKNVEDDELKAIDQAIKDGKLSRCFFSDFNILETGEEMKDIEKLPKEKIKIVKSSSLQVGIQTCVSTDTRHYKVGKKSEDGCESELKSNTSDLYEVTSIGSESQN